jgi:hypothetical protein
VRSLRGKRRPNG